MAQQTQPLVLPRDVIVQDLEGLARAGKLLPFGLCGPVGTGKTTLLNDLADRLGIQAYSYQCTPNGMAEALEAGGGLTDDVSANGNQPWAYVLGPALQAWGHGTSGVPGLLILNDIHNAGTDILSALYRVMDGAAGAALTLPSGRVLRPKPGYLVGFTSNGLFGDLDVGIQDRTRIRVPVYIPSSAMLAALHPSIAALCAMDYASLDPVATYREWRSLSDLWPIVGIARAALYALGDIQTAERMIEVCAAAGIQDAKTAVLNLAANLPSGAPRS